MKSRGTSEKKKLFEYSTVGLMFPVSIAVGLAIGYFLDQLFNTSPYLIIIFTLYGVASGFINLIKVSRSNEKKSSSDIIRRIIKISILSQIIAIFLIYIFTNMIIYSILFLSGSVISVLGFFLMIGMIDKCLKKQRGYSLFFVAGFAKMLVISCVFYFISRISKIAILFYMLGLSVIVIAIMAEAVYQFYRSSLNGRT